jgi:molybdopterin-guanine dinucleotide biosynthesis protein A
MPAWVVGILVGGRGSRMGGIAKGLLAAPDSAEPIAVRLARVAREALPAAEIVLVGAREPYAALGLRGIDDAPDASGPIAGLRALLDASSGTVIALACDLPRVSAELVGRLAAHAPGAAAVAPRVDSVWQPLFARYDAPRAREAARRTQAPWRLLESLGAVELPLAEHERALLDDWDAPEDVG